MEIKRDNQKDKSATTIPYSPDLFHNDKDFYLGYRKIEHIVAATFLVTGLIEQDELMKDEIRAHSLQCLTRMVSLIGKSAITVTDLQAVAAYLLHLNSLLDIAFWSGQISQMNLAIMQREISTTYLSLNDLSTKYKNSFYISSTFFRTDEEILTDTKEKDIIKDKNTIPQAEQLHKGQNKRQDIKDISKGQEQAQSRENKGQRREAILSLLLQKPNLTVKDFTTVVPEYSEKTIQRELLALAEEGIIKKEGERRWSTYSLKT
jgi:DNA-binding transcriptional ArsR family regulator